MKLESVNPIIIIVVIMASFLSEKVHGQKMIHITKSIVIDCNQKDLLIFLSDPLNDTRWRKNINKMDVDFSKEHGKTWTEYLKINKNKEYVTTTSVSEKTDTSITFTTLKSEHSFFQVKRTVVQLEENKSRFTTTFEFDNKMTEQITKKGLPAWLTKLLTKANLNKELKELKRKIEKEKLQLVCST